MGLADQFLGRLQNLDFPTEAARNMLGRLDGQLTPEQKAEALNLISQAELNVAVKSDFEAQLFTILPDCWFRRYLELTQTHEAPDSFHFFSALAVFSGLIGRRIRFPIGLENIYAPISVFLVSAAGETRRSGATRIASQIAQQAGFAVLSDNFTPEGVIDWLVENPHSLLVADEAGTVLNKNEYMSALPQVLCRLLDNADISFKKKLRGQMYELPGDTTVNMILACAPHWFVTSMPKAVTEGGLFSRFLFIHERTVKRLIPLPSKIVSSKIIQAAKMNVVDELQEIITKYNGVDLVYEPAAERMFEMFYRDNYKEMRSSDERLGSYFSRKPANVHRLVMNLLASEGRPIKARKQDLELVLAMFRLIEPGIKVAYRASGLEKPGQDQELVIRALDKAGGKLYHSTLLRRVSGTLRTEGLREVLTRLGQQGLVREYWDVRGQRLVPYYVLNERPDEEEEWSSASTAGSNTSE